MSCQIVTIARICDIPNIRRILYPTDDNRGSDTWLQTCKVSVSPAGDCIALARNRRLIILTSKWNSETNSSQFSVTYSDSMSDIHNITAVLCLPIVNLSVKSGHHSDNLDFSFIMVAFEMGSVCFLTETGQILYEDQPHNELIQSVTCRSQHAPRPDLCPQLFQEEIYIQYQSCICVLSGPQLFNLLRKCRLELAKCGRVTVGGEHLTIKKWGFDQQAGITDASVIGLNLYLDFDHLLTASTCGGFTTKYQSSAPLNNLVLAVGSRPYVGFHYAMQGCPQPVFTDVAKAVTSTLKSTIPWLLGGSPYSGDKQQTLVAQPIEDMGCRFGIMDLNRVGQSVILSSNHKFAVITDTLGRVILMDAHRGIILKMFKGYREAQCAFVQVPEDRLKNTKKSTNTNRVATFLIVYAPRKGYIDIFSIQEGRKITTFTASKHSILLYTNYGLFGFETTTSRSKYLCSFQTVLIDNDGQIKEFTIPFYLALPTENCRFSRDIYLFKKLKQYLPDPSENEENQLISICSEIVSLQIKKQTIDALLDCKHISPTILLKCVESIQNSISSEHSEDFLQITQNVRHLITFYLYLQELEDSSTTDTKLDLPQVENELEELAKFIDENNSSSQPKVTFSQFDPIPITQFLSAFNLGPDLKKLHLKGNCDVSTIQLVADEIYQKFLNSNKSIGTLHQQIIDCNLSGEHLLKLLIIYWENRTICLNSLQTDLHSLTELIQTFVMCENDQIQDVDFNEQSPFWAKIRTILTASKNPFASLAIAIRCKSITNKSELNPDFEAINNDTEFLSQECIAWDILIGRLEQIVKLAVILRNKIRSKPESLQVPKLPDRNFSQEISLKYVLEKGRGAVSELVTQWLGQNAINPEYLLINEYLLDKKRSAKIEVEVETAVDALDDDIVAPVPDFDQDLLEMIETDVIFGQFNVIREVFPHSLQSGVILANLCWEYALVWQKHITNLDYLEVCQNCLSTLPDIYIRIKLYAMMWNVHLKEIFETSCKLVNKVGRLPKVRFCIQDTGLNDQQLLKFFGFCHRFLNDFNEICTITMRSTTTSISKPKIGFEHIWDDNTNPSTSLIEILFEHNENSNINLDLLQLHYEIALVTYLIVSFPMKHSKPLNNLYEPYVSELLFKNFHTNPYVKVDFTHLDVKVQQYRLEFLKKIITASLDLVVSMVDEKKVFAGKHLFYMKLCVKLSRIWQLDVDQLRQHQTVEAYNFGWDSLACDAFGFVQSIGQNLGRDLLVVAGRRMAQYLVTNPKYCQNICAFTPTVTRYIKNLEKQWCAPSDLMGIEHVLRRSLDCFQDFDDHEYHLATMFLDGVLSLKTSSDFNEIHPNTEEN